MLRFSHLRTYLEVMRQGSFSAAAKATGLSQPAISQQITTLEKELGSTLLLRGPQGVLALTPAGEVFRDYAESTLAAYEAMLQEISRLRQAVEGDLQVASSAIPGTYLLPGLLMALQECYPDINVRLAVANTRDVAGRLLRRECDIGFMGAPMESQDYTLEAWIKDEIVLAVYPDHPFASRLDIVLEDLDDQPLIIREEGSGTRQTVEQVLSQHGRPLRRLKVALTLAGTHGVAHAIRSGLGIGFLSTHAAMANDLSMVRIKGLDLTRELYMAYEPARVATGLHQAFLDFARRWAAERHV
jgi:DNA-binding transcriptional LysR family regulator